MSQWDALDEHDRAWALGAVVAEAEDAALRCEACGGPKSVCQDTRNQHAYEVSFRRCYRTEAIKAAERKRGTDMDGVLTVATFNPAKRKPPKKEARDRG